ncbi:MAG: hypothetical protein BMS9Abin02_0836 [Anaerolineae bacterium]|nr:MAG: hypothetical protein BMS9Abin02_0836 [Anaerolineae bacterium]
MSEYQYHEWQTVDRTLTFEEQAQVDNLSSHIEVSSSRAAVTYNWSNFRHDPKRVLLDYFDAYFYMASWGTLRLMFRFPKGLIDEDAINPYLLEEFVSFETVGDYQVLDLEYDPEYGEGWIEAGSGLSGFIRLRDDLIEGDYRLLYLAWLKAMTISEGLVDEYESEIFYSEYEPPVPPGLKKLSPSLKHFVNIFDLDPFLVKAAAEKSMSQASLTPMNYSKLVARLPREESNAFLAALAEGKPGVAPALRKRLLAFSPKQTPARTEDPRTTRQLEQRAEELAEVERKRQAEEARKRHIAEMTALAAREEQAWREVDHLLDNGRKIASVYDDATVRLKKLEQLSELQRTEHIFQRRIRALAVKFANRQALIRRWKNQGWV